ncbi:AAA family ATPase [Pseudomonas sp. NPDC086112]|uniref:AAA family ATPase n=1 Tax=Pseudomonas sp. NPDC086112 TaxID=3364430 RepID=UPI00380EA514
MKALKNLTATPEQLALFSRINVGVEIIKGAAGSGKTTTALLKLRALTPTYVNRNKKKDDPKPVNILVLTYNKTLRGYVRELTSSQNFDRLVNLDVSTFNRWAFHNSHPVPSILNFTNTDDILRAFAEPLSGDTDFLVDEARYVLGRFTPESLGDYIGAKREGRGISPRMERPARQVLLDKVIYPYLSGKQTISKLDWNDLAVNLSRNKVVNYDLVVVDEAQDFSANELRAVLNQCSPDSSITFVLDSAQRIYSRSFIFSEIGVVGYPSFNLQKNYRNTQQIAMFAAQLLEGLEADENWTIPNHTSATRIGDKPLVLLGEHENQVAYVLRHIEGNIDLHEESVAFLHPKLHFQELKTQLSAKGMEWVNLRSEAEWPEGDVNIALSSLHSCKGLEFDHVIMIGLDGQFVDVPGSPSEYEMAARMRRLIAMAVGRARKSVIIGFKSSDAPDMIRRCDPSLYQGVQV